MEQAQCNLHGPEFQQLFEYYSPRIVQFLLNRGLSLEDAEELAQTTFLRIAQAFPRYKYSGKKFSGWVFTIARRLLLNFYRGVGRSFPRDDMVNLEDPETENIGDMTTGNPEEEYRRKEIRAAIEFALSMLDVTNRNIVLLHLVDGVDHAQIQELFGYDTVTASKSRLVRARKALRHNLEAQGIR